MTSVKLEIVVQGILLPEKKKWFRKQGRESTIYVGKWSKEIDVPFVPTQGIDLHYKDMYFKLIGRVKHTDLKVSWYGGIHKTFRDMWEHPVLKQCREMERTLEEDGWVYIGES